MEDDTFSGLTDLPPLHGSFSPFSSDEWDEMSTEEAGAEPPSHGKRDTTSAPPLTPERPTKQRKLPPAEPPVTPPPPIELGRPPPLVRTTLNKDLANICHGEWEAFSQQIYVRGRTQYVLKPQYSGYVRDGDVLATFGKAGPKRGLTRAQAEARPPFARVIGKVFSRSVFDVSHVCFCLDVSDTFVFSVCRQSGGSFRLRALCLIWGSCRRPTTHSKN
jgi:hypothetical protein